jgi:predicted permease
MTNLRVVVRGLARSPLFVAVAALSLALGIGANTAMFSLLDQFLLRTLPVRNPEQLVMLYHPGPVQGSNSTDEPGGPSFSYPMFRDLQKQQTPFTALAAARNTFVSLTYKNSALHGSARLVSGNYFDTLGVRPAMGRLLGEDDDRIFGGHPVAVLSYRYWDSRFGLDPAVLNQTIAINGYPMTIVGVAAKSFTSERIGDPPDLYVPVTMHHAIESDFNGFTDRQVYWVTLFARLKPGMTMDRAAAEINVPYRAGLAQDEQLLRQPKGDFLARFRAKKIVLKPGEHGRGELREEGREPLQVLMGMAVFVLLIACANVANLQLARSAARMREMSVRLAIGASRAQIVRQLLTESCLIAALGGVMGLFAARWTLHGVMAMLPASAGMQGFLSEELDPRVLMFCLAVSLATGILFGLFPALQASKADVVTALKDQAGQVSGSGSANFFRKALVVVQVALSLTLLVSAGLFSRTLVNISRIELGLRTDHLMTFSLLPRLNNYSNERVTHFHRQLVDRLAAIPGVTTASAALVPAIAGSSSSQTIAVEGYVPQTDRGSNSNLNVVDADYFRTLGMPLVAGREFNAADNQAGTKVAVVNEAFVRQFLPNLNPLGRHLGRGGAAAKLDTEIVGVVKDARYADPREAPPPVFFTPIDQATRVNAIWYYVRTAVEPASIAGQIRREVAALDSNLPLRELKTMDTQVEENMFAERIISTLSASFAVLATALAALGMYGVLAFNVARRTREIGIRIALGAGAGHVRGLVAREVAIVLAIGTVAGLGAAAATAKFTQSMLFGLKPWDTAVYAVAGAVLWAVSVGAAYLPARRAASVDPVVALRYE